MKTIGALSRTTNTKVETIRYYERIGLLPEPGRTEGNYRAYNMEALYRLSFIRRARDLGFSLNAVRALLSFADDKSRPCGVVDELARHHLQDVDKKIADLTALRGELSAIIASCQGQTVAQCRIIEALSPDQDAETIPDGF